MFKSIKKKSKDELKALCDQPAPADAEVASAYIAACRMLASQLRHEHDYDQAKIYYRRAIALLEKQTRAVDAEQQICLLETLIDLCLTLFEQNNYTECLERLIQIKPTIEQLMQHSSIKGRIQPLYFSCLLLMSDTFYHSQAIEDANKTLTECESLVNDTTNLNDQAHLLTIKANIYNQGGELDQAAKCYKQACKHFSDAVKQSNTRGSQLRCAKSFFNYARALSKMNQREKALELLRVAIANLLKVKGIEKDDAMLCRLRLEQARVLEQLQRLPEAIEQVTQINQIHMAIIKAQADTLHAYDLLEHLAMIKRLASWHASLDQLLEAAQCFMMTAEILDPHYPYQRLNCLRQALLYFKALEPASAIAACANTLTLMAQASLNLPVANLIDALQMINQAIALETSPERVALQHQITQAYQDYFQGWSSDLISQWYWCLTQLYDFQLNWANPSIHADDFFHWQQQSLTLPIQSRVQLMMLLSRLYCLLDQSYHGFISQTIHTTAGKKRSLYFPIGLSEHYIQTEMQSGQDVWNTTVTLHDGQTQQRGFNHPAFRPVYDAICSVQPFAAPATKKIPWFYPLCSIYNYAKHVHIGVQTLPEQTLEARSGLIQKRFKDMRIGATRMSNQIYPYSFMPLLDNRAASEAAFQALLAAELLQVVDAADSQITTVVETAEVKLYLQSITDVNAAAMAQTALVKYTKAIFTALSKTALDHSDAENIARHLLNLAAQSHGLEHTQDLIDTAELLHESFNGIGALLKQFANSQASINATASSAAIPPDQLTTTEIISGTPLAELLSKHDQLRKVMCDIPAVELDIKIFRDLHLLTQALLQHYIAHHALDRITGLLEKVQPILPPCIMAQYYTQLQQWCSSHSIEKYNPFTQPVYAPAINTACIDDDLLARINHVHRAIYYDLPFYLLLQDPHSRMLRLNITCDVFLQIHFILDQVIKRHASKALGRVSDTDYPTNEKALRKIIDELATSAQPLSPAIIATIAASLPWWRDFRIDSLRVKHVRISSVAKLVAAEFSSKCHLADLMPKHDDYCSKPCNRPGTKLLQLLKIALTSTQEVVLQISQATALLPTSSLVYNHFKTLAKEELASAKDFSAAAVARSAIQSWLQSSLFAPPEKDSSASQHSAPTVPTLDKADV